MRTIQPQGLTLPPPTSRSLPYRCSDHSSSIPFNLNARLKAKRWPSHSVSTSTPSQSKRIASSVFPVESAEELRSTVGEKAVAVADVRATRRAADFMLNERRQVFVLVCALTSCALTYVPNNRTQSWRQLKKSSKR